MLTCTAFAGTAEYPYSPVDFTKVKFSDSFWLPRMETNKSRTIPFAFKMCEDTGRIENFKAAGGLTGSAFQGDFGFNDSDVYKVIEGAAYCLMVEPDAELDAYLDEVIGYIAAAQEDDGYLYTAWTLRCNAGGGHKSCSYRSEPWDNLVESHELYNLGHMYEAAVAHYTATGKRNLLDVAIKSADLVCDTFLTGPHPGYPGHQEIEIGLAKLYRITGEKKYLDMARVFLDRRGDTTLTKYKDQQLVHNEYSQSHKPVTEQSEAVGHAVRANYMYSAMADVAALDGSEEYVEAIKRIWGNIVDKKYYITGGVGARHAGEAYGDNFELPNATAYCETCAQIAFVYMNHRMFLLEGDSKYIDVMERTLYNSVASGVSLDGKKFFYPNPLESDGKYERSPWFGCACCPSNITRFIASLPGYVYAVRGDKLYVNLYVESESNIEVGGGKLKISQQTDYPFDGKINLTIQTEQPSYASIALRVPDWAQNKIATGNLYAFAKTGYIGPKLSLNGATFPVRTEKGYVVLSRQWKQGDEIELDIPMPVRYAVSNEKVEADRNRFAISRGPLVYCAEEIDNASATQNYYLPKLPSQYQIKRHINELPEDVPAIVIDSKRIDTGEGAELMLVPYYIWNNRGAGTMNVWFARDAETALRATETKTKAYGEFGTVEASFTCQYDNVRAVIDGKLPESSHDSSIPRWTSWPQNGKPQQITFSFDKPQMVSEFAAYFYQELPGRGEVRVPESWSLERLFGGNWEPVELYLTDSYSVLKDTFNKVKFKDAKECEKIRMLIKPQEGFSAGILEITMD